jgi:NAD(P)-dependent dehydrogenase (short-subunit alcohol dehydrogenase family)
VTIKADVRHSAAMNAGVTRAITELGGLHLVVANAGLAGARAVHRPDRRELASGAGHQSAGRGVAAPSGPTSPARAAVGRIVTVSSVGGRSGLAGVAPVRHVKMGTDRDDQTVVLEHARDGITANVVAPTTVDTPLYRDDAQYRDMMPELYAQDLTFAERERRIGDTVAGGFNAIPIP